MARRGRSSRRTRFVRLICWIVLVCVLYRHSSGFFYALSTADIPADAQEGLRRLLDHPHAQLGALIGACLSSFGAWIAQSLREDPALIFVIAWFVIDTRTAYGDARAFLARLRRPEPKAKGTAQPPKPVARQRKQSRAAPASISTATPSPPPLAEEPRRDARKSAGR